MGIDKFKLPPLGIPTPEASERAIAHVDPTLIEAYFNETVAALGNRAMRPGEQTLAEAIETTDRLFLNENNIDSESL